MNVPRRGRVLFLAEAATLAHVARPVVLCQTLTGQGHDLGFAVAPSHQAIVNIPDCTLFPLQSIDSQAFTQALQRGRPVFDFDTLRGYVEEDLALFDAFKPDVVVGDFRLSLAVSARLAGIPYITISNAYWSPYTQQTYNVPSLTPLTEWLPIPIAQALFSVFRPLAFARHAHPMSRLFRYYGLPSLGHDLRRAYTEADQVLYADIPELYKMAALPEGHHFIGAILWSPPLSMPEWWDELPSGRPNLYVTLGSSGDPELLARMLSSLGKHDVNVMLSTAGQALPLQLPSNVFAAAYLPGTQACARADLVICNGGSPTTQQAISCGKPILGISRNLDQFLNMTGIQAHNAGLGLRSDRLTTGQLDRALGKLLDNKQGYRQGAQYLQDRYTAYDSGRLFREVIAQYL